MTTDGYTPPHPTPPSTPDPQTPSVSVTGPLQAPGVGWGGAAEKTTDRSRQRSRRSPIKPQVLAVGGLVVALIEVVAYVLLGLLWWVVLNAAIVVIGFIAAVVWRRRGRGRGIFDALLRRVGLGRGNGATRTGGSGGGRWPGQRGRNTSGAGRSGPSNQGRNGSGGKRSGSAGKAEGDSGRGGGPLSRIRKALNRKGRPDSAARSESGRASGAGSRISRALRRRPKSVAAGSRAGAGSTTPGGGSGQSRGWWSALRGGSARRKKTPVLPQHPTDRKVPSVQRRPDGSKPSPHPQRPGKPATESAQPPTEARPSTEQGKQDPRPTPGPTQGAKVTQPHADDSGLAFSPDQSLQRFGRNTQRLGPAFQELSKRSTEDATSWSTVANTTRKMAEQAETDLPTSPQLVAHMQGIAARASEAAELYARAAELAASVTADAESTHNLYQREHETDEERLNGGRGGRAREKRADVGYAEQDN
jgi:hypothetical protein